MHLSAHRFFMALAGLVVVCVTACDRTPPLPPTYPASGTVFKGSKPMKGGSIRFANAADPLMNIVSEIGEDGTFKLRTVKDSQQKNGAPEGDFEVTIQPPALEVKGAGGQGKYVEPIVLPKKYKLESKENTIKIELP